MNCLKPFVKETIFLAAERLVPAPPRDVVPLKDAVIRRILVAECGGIGDVLRVFPAIEHLCGTFPEAAIVLLVAPAARDALLLFKKPERIAGVMEFDIRGRHRTLRRKWELIRSLRRERFDLIYMPARGEGMRELSLLSYLIGAPYRLGFARGRTGRLNTTRVEFADDQPILQQNTSILAAAGLGGGNGEIDLRIPAGDVSHADAILREHGGDGSHPRIGIHPSASWSADARCWPVEHYVRLAKEMGDSLQAKIFLLGSASESDVGRCIEESLQSPALVNLVGKTTIGQMAALIGCMHVFIGNDSGPLHLAAAAHVPYVALFGPTSARQVLSAAPGGGVTLGRDLPCRPCYTHQPKYRRPCGAGGSPPCLQSIAVREVIDSTKVLLRRHRERV